MKKLIEKEIKSKKKNKMFDQIERCRLDLQKDPSNPSLHVRLGDLYIKWHLDIYNAGQYIDEAITEYQLAMESLIDSYEIYYKIGVAFYHKGNLDKAISYLTLALEKKHDYHEAYYMLAETFVKKSRNLEGTPTWKSIHSTLTNSNVYEIMVNNPAKATSQIASLKDYAGKMIINPAISPDGNKVAFQIPGHGMWICNSDGSNLKSLGKGSNPQWLSDNESLIYTVVTDDGTNFTASDIYSININSDSKYLLTGNTSLIPLTPSVSPDGKKVIFENAIDASIYIINLKY